MHPKWRLNHLLARGWRRIGDCGLLVWVAWLTILNRCSDRRVVANAGPVISLTTYGKRLRTVYLTIESIANGSVLPSRIVLWVDEKRAYDQPPATLRRLQARGLEIRLCPNYGPHTKYYPYVECEELFDVPMVTVDDDILYPRWWLKKLIKSFDERPDAVNCFLAKAIELNEKGIARYGEWKIAASSRASPLHVAHGVNGVIFPAPFLRILKSAGTGFQTCCPKADDIWLHAQALRAGFNVRQIRHNAVRFSAIPGTQADGLWIHNNAEGNDRAIRATYTPADIAILRASSAEQNA